MGSASPSWRRSIRRSLDSVARACGVLSWFEAQMRRRPTLLMFHRVLPTDRCRGYAFPSLAVSVEAFEAIVAHLARRAEVVTAAEAAQLAATSGRSARPVVAITFDDGYVDNFELAAPVLERHGLRGTFYVATDFLQGRMLWYDRAMSVVPGHDDARLEAVSRGCDVAPPGPDDLRTSRAHGWVQALKRAPRERREAWLGELGEPPAAAADEYRPMTREQLRQLAERGHEIGSHSVSHQILPLLPDEQLREEVVRSRALLGEWLGRDVAGFCYPNGSHDERVVDAVRAAGHDYAVTTQDPSTVPNGVGDRFRLPRIDMNPVRFSREGGGFDLTAFRAELCGLHARLR